MNESKTLRDDAFQDFYNYGRRRIYKEALPGYYGRLDLARINPEEENFVFSWLEQLLKDGALRKEINLGFYENEQFQHMFFESRNAEKLRATQELGFGFPLLLSSDGDDLIVAPLYIWSLQITPFSNRSESWLITHEREQEVRYNHFLAEFIRSKYGVETRELFEELCCGSKPDAESLAALCRQLTEVLDLDQHDLSLTLVPYPPVDRIDEMASGGVIQWSGILGLFPTQAAPLPAEEVAQMFNQETGDSEFHPFGLLDLDPHQASAIEHMLSHRFTLVEGRAGTGKTHLMIHMLTQALSNGARSLVISPSVESLRTVQEELAEWEFEPFTFLLKDAVHDKFLLLEILRAAAGKEAETVNHQESQFRIVMDKARREKTKLDENYQAIHRKVFGDFDWIQAVGHFLRSNRQEGKELLNSQLNPLEFRFNFEEYRELTEAITASYPLYQKLGTLRHPLSNLNAGIFVHKNKEEGLQFIEEKLDDLLAKSARLQHRYINKVDSYAEKLTEHYEFHYEELANRLAQLKDLMADYTSRYGRDFEEGSGLQRLFGLFSAHYRSVAEARQDVAESFEELQLAHRKSNYFDFQFSSGSDNRNMARVKEQLVNFERSLNSWRNQLPVTVQEEIKRLSHKTVHPSLDYREQIQELEYALDLLVEEANAAGLYQLPLENKNLTIPKRQKFLEQLIERLESTRFNLRDYDSFYDWQHNWFALSELARRVVKALVKVKPRDWHAALDSWYLNNCLTQAYDPALPAGDQQIDEFANQYLRLRELMIPQIRQYWQNHRTNTLKQLKRDDRETFNHTFGRRNNELSQQRSLRNVLAGALSPISNFLPVLFMPPHLAVEVLPAEAGSFDYVFLDESHFMSWLQVSPLLNLGKKVIIFRDPALDNVGYWHSVSGLANHTAGINPIPLKKIYRYNPGNLLQLNDIGNYNEQPPDSMHFEQIDGRYDEQEGNNEAEAQHLLRMLNQVQETPQRTYPSVGIACLSTGQRDLLSRYMLHIKRKRLPGAEKILQLERNGLGVFQFDELTGQHFDILIISGTLGTINTRGTLSKRVHALNRPEGLRQLRLLMSRARRKVFVLNSIPAEDLQQFAEDKQQPGLFLLANYFLFARAVHHSDAAARRDILHRTRQFIGETEKNIRPSVFLQEVATTLEPYLEPGRLRKNETIAHHFFPLLIRSLLPGQASMVIQPDGFLAKTPHTDYLWEYRCRQELSGAGYQLQPVWSARWWRNPGIEARRLASTVIKLDEAFITEEEE